MSQSVPLWTSNHKNAYASIYNNMLNLYNKACQEKWNIQKYNRLYGTKQSELFKLVVSNLLDIGGDLFYSVYLKD